MAEKSLAELAQKMKDIDFAMLSTRTENGAIAARPMSNNRDVEFDGDAFFFTCDETRTVALDEGSRPLVRAGHRHAGPGADRGGGRAAALLGRP